MGLDLSPTSGSIMDSAPVMPVAAHGTGSCPLDGIQDGLFIVTLGGINNLAVGSDDNVAWNRLNVKRRASLAASQEDREGNIVPVEKRSNNRSRFAEVNRDHAHSAGHLLA